jgi:hypothetical protein
MTNKADEIISELTESKIIAYQDHLVINYDDKPAEKIELKKIKQLTLAGDTKYIPWFLLIFLHVIFLLIAFASSTYIPTFLSWILLVIVCISGICTLLSPPENEFLVINMIQGEPVRIPMRDNKANKLEFIRKTNVHIYDLRK